MSALHQQATAMRTLALAILVLAVWLESPWLGWSSVAGMAHALLVRVRALNEEGGP